MKFAVLALIAGLCLAATTANVVVPFEEFDVDVLSGDFAEVEPYCVRSSIYWALKAALKSAQTVDCALTVASDTLGAAKLFIDEIYECPGIVTSELQAVISSTQNVITDVINIIDVSTNTCPAYDDTDTSSRSSTGWKCFWGLLKAFSKLAIDIQKTLEEIQKLPSTGPETDECVVGATTDLSDNLNNFLRSMIECSL